MHKYIYIHTHLQTHTFIHIYTMQAHTIHVSERYQRIISSGSVTEAPFSTGVISGMAQPGVPLTLARVSVCTPGREAGSRDRLKARGSDLGLSSAWSPLPG